MFFPAHTTFFRILFVPKTRSADQKPYDRAYFDRWYRHPRTRVATPRELARRVHLALSAAEYLLGRRIDSVLDVGCGEGRWYAPLRRLRPDVHYQGVDPSEYVVRRFGRLRNIRLGSFGALRSLRLARGWDLVVCSDVLQYVSADDLEPGLTEIRRLVTGVAYIEAYTAEDDMEGDRVNWHERTAAQYRRAFRRAGLTHCGLNCFVDLRALPNVNSFERASWS